MTVLEECLKSIPHSTQARQGLAQLRQVSTNDDMPSLGDQPFYTSNSGNSPEPMQDLFVDGPGDFSVNSIFTVSPDEVTQADLEAAERDLMQNNRQRLVEEHPVGPVFNDDDIRKTPPAPANLYKEEAGSAVPPASNPPAAASNSWLPVFSDEVSSPDQPDRPIDDYETQDEESDRFNRDGASETNDLKEEPSEEYVSERWSAIKWTEQAEVVKSSQPVLTNEKETAAQPVESRAQNLFFYLVVAVVIVLILLIIVLVNIVFP